MDDREAAQALDRVTATRQRLALRARWSFVRHAGFGLVMGSLVSAYSLPGQWPLLVVGCCMVAAVLIALRDRKRDGFFVNGYRAGQTRGLTFALALLSMSALAIGATVRAQYGIVWAPVMLGVAVFILCTAGSLVWEHIYQRELEGEDDQR